VAANFPSSRKFGFISNFNKTQLNFSSFLGTLKMFLNMFEEDKQRVAACSTATQQCIPHFPLSTADIFIPLPLNTSFPHLLVKCQQSRSRDELT